jgi:hypothetical protein
VFFFIQMCSASTICKRGHTCLCKGSWTARSWDYIHRGAQIAERVLVAHTPRDNEHLCNLHACTCTPRRTQFRHALVGACGSLLQRWSRAR